MVKSFTINGFIKTNQTLLLLVVLFVLGMFFFGVSTEVSGDIHIRKKHDNQKQLGGCGAN